MIVNILWLSGISWVLRFQSPNQKLKDPDSQILCALSNELKKKRRTFHISFSVLINETTKSQKAYPQILLVEWMSPTALTLFNDFIHWFSLNLGLLSVEPPLLFIYWKGSLFIQAPSKWQNKEWASPLSFLTSVEFNEPLFIDSFLVDFLRTAP